MSDLEAKKLAVAELKPMAQEENDKVERDYSRSADDLEKGLDNLVNDENSTLKDALRDKIAKIKKDSSLTEEEKRDAIKKAQEDFDAELERIKQQQKIAKKIFRERAWCSQDISS